LPHRYLKLTQPIDIFTCVGCYARPDIRQRLDDDVKGRRSLLDYAFEPVWMLRETLSDRRPSSR